MATRYVNGKKGKDSGQFTLPTAPARTVGAALKVAVAGDTVEIQDAGSYPEGELVIDKPLTLLSSYVVANPSADPTAAGFDARVLPELTVAPGTRTRVLRIAGTPETRATMGPVRVSGLRVAGGHAVHTAAEPALGCGGGIAVVDADDVRIERCAITGNRTTTAPLASWPESDRVALRTAVVELVGEIVSPATVALINKLIDGANIVLAVRGLPRLAPLDRAKILTEIAREFDAKLAPGRPNSWLAGQAFGGGIATVWASPTVRDCLLRGNGAEGRGAGLAVVGYGWPTIERCWFDANATGAQGRRDGGGVGCEISLPGKLPRNLSEIDLVRFLTAKVAAVKAALGSPLSGLTTFDVLEFSYWLANPYRPSPPVRGVKRIVLELIAGNFKEAGDHALYYLATSALSRDRWDAWKRDEIERARKTAVAIADCRFTKNRCEDDGGGLYASVLSRVKLTRSRFNENVARGSGGGIRLTMGSAGEIAGCELSGNTALTIDPDGKLVTGGGGLSARNVDLTLTETRIGSSGGAIAADSNVCTDHAGGGLCFQADTEGNLAGIPDFWTTILREVFEVSAVKVVIAASCAIAGNGAGYDEGRRPLGGTKKAKGGGVWALQGTFPDAPRLSLRIERFAATVRDNQAQTKGYESKVVKGLKLATANQLCVQDMIGRHEWTESNLGSLVDAAGDLRFAP